MCFLLLCLLLGFPFVSTALSSCLTENGVPFELQHSRNWTAETTPWNLRLRYKPDAVAKPTNLGQVQAAVRCGALAKIHVTAKSGGHSFGSFGFGGEDGHLVLSFDDMARVTLANDGIATVQPGATLGKIATELFNQGSRAIPHGECPAVGIAGHVLHGGLGLISRLYGMTLDWLDSATVVLANATAVQCSEKKNPDIFWALRGAGSSFGIVTELKFRTLQAPKQVTPFSLPIEWPKEKAKAIELFKDIQDFALSAPKELTMNYFLHSNGQNVDGMYFGSYVGLSDSIRPLLSRLNTSLEDAKTVTWIEGLEHLAGGLKLNEAQPSVLQHDWFYATSAMTPALSTGQIEPLIDSIYANMQEKGAFHSWSYILEMHGGPQSAIAALSDTDTAFPHRHKPLLHQFSSVAPPMDTQYQPGFTTLAKFRESITQHLPAEWGMYANYVDTQLNSTEAQQRYWAGNLERLRNLKQHLDPDQLFWNPQSITPSF